MSEPIIIDNVDVSMCKYLLRDSLNESNSLCSDSFINYRCKQTKYCYYKQLLNLKKANELLFKMAILTVNNFANTEDYNILKYEWFDYFKNRNIKDLREYKNNIMDRLKNYKKVAHDIDKEIEKRLKNSEVEE